MELDKSQCLKGWTIPGKAIIFQDSTQGLGCFCLSPTCGIQDPSHHEKAVKRNYGGEEENFLSGGHGVWDKRVVSRKEALFAYLQTYFGKRKVLESNFSLYFKKENRGQI